ncbi:xanthine dehydrogenase family protein subunit M [Variovorax defluvii]|uniref:Xanthine dehydrogenase family protein subunit M n=1 Tax=Variovorax defluvii TaxID=913761 RepID=A0ABP8I4N8_9BURK
MKHFEYSEPASLDEAVALLRAGPAPASLIAGGTDLMVQMKEHVRQPAHVINIKKIPGMDDFAYDPRDGLLLGALVTTRQVETSPVTLRHYASLARAATDFASIQVRHRATVVGNVCRASPSADTLPALIADGAVLRIHGPSGRRRCAVEHFCTGPGRTVLAADEIVTHIEIPAPPPRTGKVYIKHGRRAQMELATVGVAVRLTLDVHGGVDDLAIVLAAVAPTPLRAVKAEAALRGKRPTAELLTQAALAASAEARPIGDVRGSAAYRREMVRVLTRRALEQALAEIEP